MHIRVEEDLGNEEAKTVSKDVHASACHGSHRPFAFREPVCSYQGWSIVKARLTESHDDLTSEQEVKVDVDKAT